MAVKIKTTTPERAEQLIEVFSDIVFEKVIQKIEYLEHRTADDLKLFECKEDKINLIYSDALLFDNSNLESVDMLYIDAAKGQYIKFFEKYVSNLNEGGVIIFDNLLFHGFVKMEQKDIKNRNTRQLIRKLKEFLEYIQNHPEYDFELIEEGDGIGIARKKGL